VIFDSNKQKSSKERNNSIDEGIVAFGLWVKSKEEISSLIPMSLKRFVQDKLVVLNDRILKKEVAVEISDGIPICKECNSNDCSHVGFAICAEQLERRARF
jgi:hypothetical protein